MAKLSNEKMTLELTFTGYEYKWVGYEIKFLWEAIPVINDAVLKRVNEHWNKRSKGAFIASDDERDRLIPVIKKVLETDTPDYWQPIDPDVTIEIYPDDLDLYPPVESHFRVIKICDEWVNDAKKREELKKKIGQLDDDLFVVVTRIDAYNFKNQDAYCNFGTSHSCCISLLLTISRADLKQFVADLETEYKDLCNRYGIEPEEILEDKSEAVKECPESIKKLEIIELTEHPKGYFVGQWIEHFHFGKGRVRSIEGNIITISFEGCGIKRLDLNYAYIQNLDQRYCKRLFFEAHPLHTRGHNTCPCCGYPTLDGLRTYEECFLCGWENAQQPYGNEQDDHNADKVLGGFNGDYSLTDARQNFEKYTAMFRPDDRSFYTQLFFMSEIIDIKKKIKSCFDRLVMVWDKKGIDWIWNDIEKHIKDLRSLLRSAKIQ